MEKLLNDAHAELALLKAQREGDNVKTPPGVNKRNSPNAAVEPSVNPPAKKLKAPETPPSSSGSSARGFVQPQARHSHAHFNSLSRQPWLL